MESGWPHLAPGVATLDLEEHIGRLSKQPWALFGFTLPCVGEFSDPHEARWNHLGTSVGQLDVPNESSAVVDLHQKNTPRETICVFFVFDHFL